MTALALVLLTGGLLGACNSGSDNSAKDPASTTTAAGPTTTTTAPPPPEKVLTVTYTETYGPDSQTPADHSNAEISFDGASFRTMAGDGSSESAYDAANGRVYQWSKAAKGVPESADITTGAVTGGPNSGVFDGPPLPVAVLVRTLGRAGDSRVATITSHGRPAWHYDGPMVGDRLGGGVTVGHQSFPEDHVVVDVDKASGVALLEVQSAKGQETRRFEATSVEARTTEDRTRYHPEPPATAKVRSTDHGFRAMTLDEVAAASGYDVLVPASVPDGFELDEVLFDAKQSFGSGAEGLNPAPARVTALRWRHPDGSSFNVTLLPENGDPKAKQEGQIWSDPFGGEGVELPATKVSLPLEGRKPLAGELFVAAPSLPHLWGITGDLVVSVAGDLDAAGLKSVAGSLRKHTPTAPPSGTAAAKCPPVGFTPNSDDVAGDIAATGLDCTEASALVRRAHQEHDPVTGPRFFRLEPFTCRAVRQGTTLESTAYRCDDAARRVTWTKT
jgi:hypothetical protein